MNGLERDLGVPARSRRAAAAESGTQSFRDWVGNQ